jgi:multidrug efflux pump subunit AcrA (membrane-fusion protein)
MGAAMSPLRGWVVEPERLRPKTHVGQEVEVRLSVPKLSIPCAVDYVADEVAKDTRAIKVRAAIPNPDGRLRADMFVRLRFVGP